MKLRVLSAEDVQQALAMPDAISATREAFRALHGGSVQMPERLQLEADGNRGVSLFMPVHGRELGRTCLKLVSVYPGNRDRDVPVVNGLVLLVDGRTGVPIAALEGGSLTAIRTGAATGVATDLLAVADAETLAVIGAGAQAPYQALAVCAVRPVRRLRVFNRTRDRAEGLAIRLRERLPEVVVDVAASPGEALAGADVVCTATSASEPVLDGADVAPGAHVNAIGSFRPDMRELPRDLFERAATTVVDDVEAAMTEAGEVVDAVGAGILARDQLLTLGAVLERGPPVRREGDVTVFKSSGLAVQDLYAASLAVDVAVENGWGGTLEL